MKLSKEVRKYLRTWIKDLERTAKMMPLTEDSKESLRLYRYFVGYGEATIMNVSMLVTLCKSYLNVSVVSMDAAQARAIKEYKRESRVILDELQSIVAENNWRIITA